MGGRQWPRATPPATAEAIQALAIARDEIARIETAAGVEPGTIDDLAHELAYDALGESLAVRS